MSDNNNTGNIGSDAHDKKKSSDGNSNRRNNMQPPSQDSPSHSTTSTCNNSTINISYNIFNFIYTFRNELIHEFTKQFVSS